MRGDERHTHTPHTAKSSGKGKYTLSRLHTQRTNLCRKEREMERSKRSQSRKKLYS